MNQLFVRLTHLVSPTSRIFTFKLFILLLFISTFVLLSACSRKDSVILPSMVDTDDDGLTDEEEEILGTDQKSGDSDGDGLFDSDEATYGSNPNDSDSDDDGLTDSEEKNLGTNPNDSDSDDDGVADSEDTYPLDSTNGGGSEGEGEGEGEIELIYHYLKTEIREEKSDIQDIYKTLSINMEILAYNEDDGTKIDSLDMTYSIVSTSGTYVTDDENESSEAISPELLPVVSISNSTLSIMDDDIDYNVSSLTLSITISSLHTSGTTSEVTEDITVKLAVDEEAPKVVSYFPIPPDSSYTYPVTSEVSVLFDSSLSEASLDKLKLYKGSYDAANIVAGSVKFDNGGYYVNEIMAFYPDNELEYDTTYIAVIEEGVEDYFDNLSLASFSWEFTTEEAIVTTNPPEVTYTNPKDGGDTADEDEVIQIVFSHDMADMTGKIKVYEGSASGSQIAGQITSYGCSDNCSSGELVEFEPVDGWDLDTTYYVVVSANSEDMYGNQLGDDYTFNFSTLDDANTSPEELTAVMSGQDSTDSDSNYATELTWDGVAGATDYIIKYTGTVYGSNITNYILVDIGERGWIAPRTKNSFDNYQVSYNDCSYSQSWTSSTTGYYYCSSISGGYGCYIDMPYFESNYSTEITVSIMACGGETDGKFSDEISFIPNGL